MTKLTRLLHLATMHETRRAIVAAARSGALRTVARRAATDRRALLRDLRDPANARSFVRRAARHPAARELADAGMLVLPVRFLPLGWIATWVAKRLVRRYADGSPRRVAAWRR